jgi:hypothetical protein
MGAVAVEAAATAVAAVATVVAVEDTIADGINAAGSLDHSCYYR